MENASDIFMVMSSEENMQWWNIGFCYGCSTTYNPQKKFISKTFRSRPQNAKLLLAHKSLLKSLFPLRLDVKIYSLTNSTQVL